MLVWFFSKVLLVTPHLRWQVPFWESKVTPSPFLHILTLLCFTKTYNQRHNNLLIEHLLCVGCLCIHVQLAGPSEREWPRLSDDVSGWKLVWGGLESGTLRGIICQFPAGTQRSASLLLCWVLSFSGAGVRGSQKRLVVRLFSKQNQMLPSLLKPHLNQPVASAFFFFILV